MFDIMNREILLACVEMSENLEILHLVVYCEAMAVVRTLKVTVEEESRQRQTGERAMPRWEQRLNTDIVKLRSDIARPTSYVSGTRSTRLGREVNEIMRRNSVHTQRDELNATVQQCLDILKQKRSVLSARLPRNRVYQNRKKDNSVCLPGQRRALTER